MERQKLSRFVKGVLVFVWLVHPVNVPQGLKNAEQGVSHLVVQDSFVSWCCRLAVEKVVAANVGRCARKGH
jgi:hypothetical protein